MTKKKMKVSQDLDSANMDTLIGFSWYQLFHILTMKLVDLSVITCMSFMMFAAEFPKLSCALETMPGELLTITDKDEVCRSAANATCELSYYFRGIAVEWELYCPPRRAVVYLAMSVQMVGVLVGAPTFGQLSDTFGRKKIGLLVFTFMCLFGFACGFACAHLSSWQMFVAFRFFIGVFAGGSVTVCYVFRIEFIRSRHRVWVGALASLVSYMCFSVLAYVVGEWRMLAWVGSATGVVPILLVAIFAKESPRWLLQKGRVDEAKQTLRDIARWNRDELSETLLEAVVERELTRHRKRTRPHSFWHLFYSWKLVKFSIILPFAWFTVSCISYGIMFGITKLAGSPFLNSLIYGGLRGIISVLLAAGDLWVPWCGRKFFHGTGSAVIGSICVLLFAIFVTGSNTVAPYSEVVRIGALLAACSCSFLWVTAYLYSAELYPTPVRNLANSFCSVFARVGGIVAPQILYISEFWAPATYLVFGCLALIDGILFQLLLPETKGRPLPEQMPPKEEKARLAECCGAADPPEPNRIPAASSAKLIKPEPAML